MAGVFGLAVGALVLLISDSLADRVVWLAENYRHNGLQLLDQQVLDVSSGVRIWGWSGIIAGSVGLTLGWPTGQKADCCSGVMARWQDNPPAAPPR